MMAYLNGFVKPGRPIRLRRKSDDYLDARQVAIAIDEATALHIARVAYHATSAGVSFVAADDLPDIIGIVCLEARRGEP